MAMRYVRAAARADGPALLEPAGADGGEFAGAAARQLLQTVFGPSATGSTAPAELVGLVAQPQDNEAENALYRRIDDMLAADAVTESAVTAVLTDLYRRAFAAGDTQALVTMGDLMRNCGDNDTALAAYQQAATAGNAEAVFALACLLDRGFGDPDAAAAVCQEAIDAGDPETSPQALVHLGYLLARGGRDEAAAQAAFRHAVESGHPRWALAGMKGMGFVAEQQGDPDAAATIYRQIIDSGNPEWGASAAYSLGRLLEDIGDSAGAKAAYGRAVSLGPSDEAAGALGRLLDMLAAQGDLDAARSAHQLAVQVGNSNAAYALVVIAQLLRDLGDPRAARAALEQAAADGDSLAIDMLEDEPNWPH
jgi:tetratricopeptide (TPR) repeat protein